MGAFLSTGGGSWSAEVTLASVYVTQPFRGSDVWGPPLGSSTVILVWPNSVPAFTHGSLRSLFFPGVTVLFFKNMNQIVYIYTVEILY